MDFFSGRRLLLLPALTLGLAEPGLAKSWSLFSRNEEKIDSQPKVLDIPLKRRTAPRKQTSQPGVQNQKLNQRNLKATTSEDLLKQQEEKLVIEQELLNYLNFQYYSTFYFGSQHQEVTLILDTGSSVSALRLLFKYMWVPTDHCLDCSADTNEVFHNERSTSYQRTEDRGYKIQYGVGSVEGYPSTDLVCLDAADQGLQSKNCLRNYDFLSVYLSHDLSNLESDGLLGLAPSDQGSGNRLFIEELYNAGIIGQQVFALSLGRSAYDAHSRVVLGGYNLAYAQPGHNITWAPLIDTQYWTVGFDGLSVSGQDIPISTPQAVIDSGASFISVPHSDFQHIVTLFSEKNSMFPQSERRACVVDKKVGILKCACDSDTQIETAFPTLEVRLGGNPYQLKPEFYAIKLQEQCYFKFAPGGVADQHGFWILGDAFLLNYMAVFDLAGKRVGLVPALHMEAWHLTEAAYWLALALVFMGGAAALCKEPIQEWLRSRKQQRATVAGLSAPVPSSAPAGNWFQSPVGQSGAEYELQYRAPVLNDALDALSGRSSTQEDGEMAFSETTSSHLEASSDTEK